MKRQMMTAVAVCALAFAAGCASTSEPAAGAPGVEQTASTTPAPVVSGMRADYPVTAEGATAFIADAETKWAEVSEYVARIQWARATNITFDTMWLEAKVHAEMTEFGKPRQPPSPRPAPSTSAGRRGRASTASPVSRSLSRTS